MAVQPDLPERMAFRGHAGCTDDETLSAGQLQDSPPQQGHVDHVTVRPRQGVQTHHVESQPGGHRAGIVVAGQAPGAVAERAFDDFARAFGTPVRTPDPMVQATG